MGNICTDMAYYSVFCMNKAQTPYHKLDTCKPLALSQSQLEGRAYSIHHTDSIDQLA